MVLLGLDKYPASLLSGASVLFTNMGEKEIAYTLPVAAQLRAEGIACEVYPDAAKLKKQFEYADRKGIPYLAIVGDQEMADGVVTLKNLATGEQRPIPCGALAEALK